MLVDAQCPHCDTRAQIDTVPDAFVRCATCGELFKPVGGSTASAGVSGAPGLLQFLSAVQQAAKAAQNPSGNRAGDVAIRSRLALPAGGMIVVAALGIMTTLMLFPALRNDPDPSGQMIATILISVQFICCLVVIAAGVQMFRLKTYRFAVLGSVLASLPIVGPCCGVSLIFGIWALIVLIHQEVRASFD